MGKPRLPSPVFVTATRHRSRMHRWRESVVIRALVLFLTAAVIASAVLTQQAAK